MKLPSEHFHFRLLDFRKDVDDDSVLDIAGYRWVDNYFIDFKYNFRKEFVRFDENNDGEIDVLEFGQFLRGIGLIPTDDEVKVKMLKSFKF